MSTLFAMAMIVATAAALTYLLILALFPLLRRYAMARPNARSSHKVPTAQGGGAAVVTVTLVIGLAGLLVNGADQPGDLAILFMAVAAMAVLGALDDVRPLPVLPRLALQFGAAVLVVTALPPGARVLPALPGFVETLMIVIGLVWFINLTNFMDGIDWMTVVQKAPVCLFLIIMAWLGALPVEGGIMALALLGALLGFAPFNRHVARLFLGDVGSLAIGALVGWLLLLLAAEGHLAAALLLPLYYLADATVTLYLRWRRGERLSEAHRSHFYQRATASGLTVPQVTNRVLLLNLTLGALAVLAVLRPTLGVQALTLGAGAVLTGVLLAHFGRGRTRAKHNPSIEAS